MPAGVEADAFSLGVKVLFKSFFGVLMIAFSIQKYGWEITREKQSQLSLDPLPFAQARNGMRRLLQLLGNALTVDRLQPFAAIT